MKARTIWKWSLVVTDVQAIQMPGGAQLLAVQMQGGAPQLWALVDPTEAHKEMRTIRIFGTGNPIGEYPGDYLGTFQLDGGALVFHAFCSPLSEPGEHS